MPLAAASGARGSADSTTAPPPATTRAAATGELDGSFDVGGHKLHLRCEGRGSVRDLHARLAAAAVPGPYLLVGFSFGGGACWPSCTPAPTPTRSWGC